MHFLHGVNIASSPRGISTSVTDWCFHSSVFTSWLLRCFNCPNMIPAALQDPAAGQDMELCPVHHAGTAVHNRKWLLGRFWEERCIHHVAAQMAALKALTERKR